MKYLFIGICMLISVLMVFEAWKYDNIASLLGWIMAFAFQTILFLEDIFDSSTKESEEYERKRLEAFNKLMNADESKK